MRPMSCRCPRCSEWPRSRRSARRTRAEAHRRCSSASMCSNPPAPQALSRSRRSPGRSPRPHAAHAVATFRPTGLRSPGHTTAAAAAPRRHRRSDRRWIPLPYPVIRPASWPGPRRRYPRRPMCRRPRRRPRYPSVRTTLSCQDPIRCRKRQRANTSEPPRRSNIRVSGTAPRRAAAAGGFVAVRPRG